MSLRTAIDTLAGMSVTGVKKSFDIDELRGGVHQADLPALVPVIWQGDVTRIGYSKGSNVHDMQHKIRHRLLERPAQGALEGEALAAVTTLIDNYLAALRIFTPTTGARDIAPLQYEAGIVTWGGIDYYGVDFITLIEVEQ